MRQIVDQGGVQYKLLHVHLEVKLAFVLQLGQVNEIPVTNYLVGVMSETEKEGRPSVTDSRILKLKFQENTREMEREVSSNLQFVRLVGWLAPLHNP